jgi:hypothetical protein
MSISVYKGIDRDGKSIFFLDGDGKINPDTVVKQISELVEIPFGDPADGTIASKVGNLGISFSLAYDDDVEDCLVCKCDDSEQPRTINDNIRFFAKAHDSESEDDEYEGIAIGIVMEPNDGKEGAPLNPDTQGEVFGKEVVAKTAYEWMASGGAVDFMHSFKSLEKNIVEVLASDVTKGAITLGEGDNAYSPAVGTWILTTRWDTSSKFWKDIKAGKLAAYSPGGLSRGYKVEDDDEKQR